MILPLWEDCEKAVKSGTATPIEAFIYENEPAGESAEWSFREGLSILIVYVEQGRNK